MEILNIIANQGLSLTLGPLQGQAQGVLAIGALIVIIWLLSKRLT